MKGNKTWLAFANENRYNHYACLKDMKKILTLVLLFASLFANAQEFDYEDDNPFYTVSLKASERLQKKENAGDTAFIITFRTLNNPVRLNDVNVIDGIEDYELTVQFKLSDYYNACTRKGTSVEINNSSINVAYKGLTYYIQEIRILEDFNVLLVIRPFLSN